jgi:6-phosphofructokinase 1
MLPPQGLSHIVCHVGNREDYTRTRDFYLAIGFKHILKESNVSDAVTWLVLAAAPAAMATDVTIQLILSTAALDAPTADVTQDAAETWEMKDVALVLTIKDIEVSGN